MIVISAWWRSNMPFQRLRGRLNDYKTRWRQEVRVGDQMSLETRSVGEKMLEWEHVPERLGPQAPGWAAQENENDTRWYPEGLGRSICCSLCSVFNSLSHPAFQIKSEVYFSKNSVARRYYCVMILHAYVDVYVLCVYIVGHGYCETIQH